jgi:tetratricopeptide (TPR) repeat protein
LRSAELAYYGRIRESHKAATRAVELLRQQGQAQRANLVVSNQAILAATLEPNSEARSYADSLRAEPGDLDLLINLAFVYGALGETAKARRLYSQVKPTDIPDPALAQLLSQSFDAMLLLHSGRPAEALARLESLPDVKQPFLLTCLLTRARAAAASQRWPDAERDYRDVLSRQKGSQFNLAVPISHAGLARTLAAQGKTSEAREEFKTFFGLWNDADAELPMVVAAKAEAAKLGS